MSNSFINQTISALKVLRQDVLGLSLEDGIKIKRPRKTRQLPTILSCQEVHSLIDVTGNPKHKAVPLLGELINLGLRDIDSTRMRIRVVHGKGNKSRDTLLAEKTLHLLRNYYKFIQPKPLLYVFEAGWSRGKPYSASSVRKIVKRAAAKAGIKKDISPHSLRHAFATHLLEQGTNLKVIQKLLGHTSLRSTMVYLHVAAIDDSLKSPLDRI